jgi:hypothetical protein
LQTMGHRGGIIEETHHRHHHDQGQPQAQQGNGDQSRGKADDALMVSG